MTVTTMVGFIVGEGGEVDGGVARVGVCVVAEEGEPGGGEGVLGEGFEAADEGLGGGSKYGLD